MATIHRIKRHLFKKYNQPLIEIKFKSPFQIIKSLFEANFTTEPVKSLHVSIFDIK